MNEFSFSNRVETVMMVEDTDDHIELISIFVKELFPQAKIVNYKDGQQALDAVGLLSLNNSGKKIDPDLILLDINLPKFDGIEVLSRIRAHSRFDHVPVVVMTTSSRKEEKDKMILLGANAFMVKFADNLDLAKELEKFFNTNQRI